MKRSKILYEMFGMIEAWPFKKAAPAAAPAATGLQWQKDNSQNKFSNWPDHETMTANGGNYMVFPTDDAHYGAQPRSQGKPNGPPEWVVFKKGQSGMIQVGRPVPSKEAAMANAEADAKQSQSRAL